MNNYKKYNDYNHNNNYRSYINNPETAANAIICLLHQTNFILDQKLRWLEEKFISEGGFRENLFRKRLRQRKIWKSRR